MKRVSWRAYLGCLAFFIFACLLLSGAQRLIAVDRQSVQAETERVICSRSEYSVHERMQRQSDANGNILSGRSSYLRAVYQAFPLGDGFA